MTTADDVPTDLCLASLPRHVAIIMDGNGRWAKARNRPRFAGHRAGVERVREIVEACSEQGIEALTLFAFSSENWRRPKQEVRLLMDLLWTALNREIKKLHDNGVVLRFIGDRSAFSARIRQRIEAAEALTAANPGMTLVVAINYGGRWDIVQAARRLAREVAEGRLAVEAIDEARFAGSLSIDGLPDPDLFIRTGGEQRISNFLLWHLAYTEFYFTEVLWPDFGREALADALASFGRRQRRFGMTGDQVESLRGA